MLNAQYEDLVRGDSAYNEKNYEKAFEYLDKYYSDTTHGRSNWNCYEAAISACKTAHFDKAKHYFDAAAKIGFDYSYYSVLIKDTPNCLQTLPEWHSVISELEVKYDSVEAILKPIRNLLYDTSIRINQTALTDSSYWKNIGDAQKLISKIKNFNAYPTPKKTGFWTLDTIKIDTLNVPFLLYIPSNYNPKEKNILYVFLHGAVSGRKDFIYDAAPTIRQQNDLFKAAFKQNAFVLYPSARKDFNWLYHQKAFETILNEIALVKSLYNIDDNKVYIGGHSDGARGTFWFAVNNRTTFAAFYPICYFPSVYTGNTELFNLKNNQSIDGISDKGDNIFPLNMVDSVYDYAKEHGANWKNFVVNGEHSLPYDSPDSVYFIFDTVATKQRNPFPKKIQWQTDNVINGRNYWLEITALDTTATRADWQQDLNPPITTKEGKHTKFNFNKNKSGAYIATIDNNVVDIKTSCIKQLTFYASPELINLKKPVKIYVNGKLVFNDIIKEDKNVIADEFLKTKDKSLIVVNKIKINVP